MKQVISETKYPVKIWTDYVEDEALAQLKNMAGLPFIYNHVAVMPDCHAGKGSTVGTVIATKGAIIPAAVGVDIGCGMCAVKLPFKIDQISDVASLRSKIEEAVPVGFSANGEISKSAEEKLLALGEPRLSAGYSKNKMRAQLGSLGGGNHFIEICHDENNDAWIMLHSGSRNIGKTIADVHINGAKELMKRYFIDLPDPDLAYLVEKTNEFQNYLHDLHWAQKYAYDNRSEMMERVFSVVTSHVDIKADLTDVINCHHNYTQKENHFGSNVWVTRKGAVSAKAGELGIIPGSMGAKSFIVTGRGSTQSFCSCAHGAGRKMSRTRARKTFTNEDLIKQTSGVECRKDDGVLDEIPSAYKDIDEVMANQADLVDIKHTLKQILCVKG